VTSAALHIMRKRVAAACARHHTCDAGRTYAQSCSAACQHVDSRRYVLAVRIVAALVFARSVTGTVT